MISINIVFITMGFLVFDEFNLYCFLFKQIKYLRSLQAIGAGNLRPGFIEQAVMKLCQIMIYICFGHILQIIIIENYLLDMSDLVIQIFNYIMYYFIAFSLIIIAAIVILLYNDFYSGIKSSILMCYYKLFNRPKVAKLENLTCKICLISEVQMLNSPCNHICQCLNCYNKFERKICPMCNKDIISYMRIYI